MNIMFDKNNWQIKRFEEVACLVNETSKDLVKDGIDKYIGLEHLTPGDVNISKWGDVANGTTFTRSFSKGDVLFGRRRAYQKKAARAEFGGVCSGDILVFRAKENILLPGLLPYIVQNDIFFDQAVKTSAGSLSPRTKFKDLAKLQLSIPELSQQKKILEIFQQFESSILAKHALKIKLAKLNESVIESASCQQGEGRIVKVSDVACVNKQSLGAKTPPDYEFKYLDIASIISPKRIADLKTVVYKEAPSRARRIVHEGDIVLSLVRPYQQSFARVYDAKDVIASTGIAVVEPEEDIDGDYLYHHFFSRDFLKYCERKMTGTNYPAITPTDIKEYEMFVPYDIERQRTVAAKLNNIDAAINLAERLINKEQQLKRVIAAQLMV